MTAGECAPDDVAQSELQQPQTFSSILVVHVDESGIPGHGVSQKYEKKGELRCAR